MNLAPPDPATKKALQKKAEQIAAMLGETKNAPRAQLHRILCLMGEEWVGMVVKEVEKLAQTSAIIAHKEDGEPRTIGGMFFKSAKTIAWVKVEAGELPRPVFHRVFHGWTRKPKPPPPPPKPKKPPPPPKKKAAPPKPPPGGPKPRPYPNGDRRKNGPRPPAPMPEVEVYRPRRAAAPMPEITTIVRRRPSP